MVGPCDLPENLTDQQLSAILHRGSPLLIIAGPGSGKTEVIAWRVAHLVRAGHVRPENVLAVTFTNKAALELKDRIQAKLPEVNVELMHVSTIHSFCADLLRRYRPHTALPRGLRILDEAGQFLFVYGNRKALGLDALVKGRLHDSFAAVIGAFNLATEELVEPAGPKRETMARPWQNGLPRSPWSGKTPPGRIYAPSWRRRACASARRSCCVCFTTWIRRGSPASPSGAVSPRPMRQGGEHGPRPL